VDDDTKQSSRFSATVQYLVIIPAAAFAMGALSIAHGGSVVRGIALGLWLAATAMAASILFPRGYVFATPHLARPDRRLRSWLVLVVVLVSFLAVVMTLD
jgi:hypothetical protein